MTCTTCEHTEGFVSKAGSDTCTYCGPGFFADLASHSCKECEIGKYSIGGKNECNICPAGTDNQVASTGCAPCPPGTVIIGNTCVECDKGEYAEFGATSCSACSGEGEYSAEKGHSACSTAKAGSKPSSDRKGEEQCLAGTYSTGGANECMDCDPGFISNDPDGAGFCSPCPAGYFTNPSQTACLPCSPGSISGIAATHCDACEVGKFASGSNNTGCLFCDDKDFLKGSTTNSTGATSSSSCICEPSFYENELTKSCEPVFEGVSKSVSGMTVENMKLEQGFWRTTTSSKEVRRKTIVQHTYYITSTLTRTLPHADPSLPQRTTLRRRFRSFLILRQRVRGRSLCCLFSRLCGCRCR
jgi:hypothetical protein